MKNVIYVVVFVILVSCSPKTELAVISNKDSAFNYIGEEIEIFTLENENGLLLAIKPM